MFKKGLEALSPFDFDPRTRVVYGPGSLLRIADAVRDSGASRVLVVSDPGIVGAGHTDVAVDVLNSAGIKTLLFSEVTQNPTTEDVERGVAVARAAGIDGIVAVGGGSSIDCAKGINFILTNGGQMRDYWGIGKASRPMLPLIAVPTTAGTGSEAQSFALISDAVTHAKMACGDKKAACRVAILDPNLIASMPRDVAAATGIDAISHAVESYVTKTANPVSRLFSRQAWKLLSQAFPITTSPDQVDRERMVEHDPSERIGLEPRIDLTARAFETGQSPWAWGFDPEDVRNPAAMLEFARGAMLLGAHLAGAAIENSMLGATHSMANPLTAAYGTTHGVAIGVLLPHVIEYNSWTMGSAYTELAADAGICEADDPTGGQKLAAVVAQLVAKSGLPTCLAELGVESRRLKELSAQAARQWTAGFNPRDVDETSFEQIYLRAMTPFGS